MKTSEMTIGQLVYSPGTGYVYQVQKIKNGEAFYGLRLGKVLGYPSVWGDEKLFKPEFSWNALVVVPLSIGVEWERFSWAKEEIDPNLPDGYF